MAQWGTRYRIVFLGRHEENKTQLSSSISEEEVKAVKVEPLEIPEIKKRRRLSCSELKELKEASHYKKRPSSSKGMTKECNNAIERWTVERYKRAEQAMLEILKAEDATFGNPVSRRELRMAARKRIGDTGLLDHLLKHVDGKVAPGGTERFRRWFNTSGRMEYWLESADLANIRREARVHDPYWIPSSTLMPGGGPLDDSVSGGELKLLKAEVDKMKSDIQELLLSQKQENDQANQERLEDLAKWKAQSEQSLKVILGSWKGMQDNFEELKKWKSKVERQVVEITNILSDMQGPKQNTVSKPEEPEQWEDWLESSNLDSFQGNELVPWFESTNNLVNSEEEVIIQDPYLALPLSSKHGDSSSQDLFCKLKEEMAEMERNRDVRELVPEKQREYQANLTPDSSATANSKSDLDNLVVFQEMFQELFNWKSTTEQKLSEISNSMNVMKQNPKLLTPPAPQLPEDGNHCMEYHPCFMF